MLIVLAVVAVAFPSFADLVFIAGRLPTSDARPLMWMTLEDAQPDRQVELRRVSLGGGRFDHIAVFVLGTTEYIVGGVNTVGLGVVVSIPEDRRSDPHVLRYVADVTTRWLADCYSVADVDIDLPAQLPDPRLEGARWGVIDAQGAAAGFRVENGIAARFDASVTTLGYIVSDTREDDLRRQRFERIAQDLSVNGRLEPRHLIDGMTRDLGRRAVSRGDPTRGHALAGPDAVCAVVIQGAGRGHDPGLSTIWAILGHPVVAPATPVWARTPELPGFFGTGYGLDLNEQARAKRRSVFSLEGVVRDDSLAGLRGYLDPLEDRMWGKWRTNEQFWTTEIPDGGQVAATVRDMLTNIALGYRLCAVGTFSGYVRDGRTKQPIVGATVQYIGQVSGECVSRDGGFYFTPDLQPGEYSLAAYAEDYGNASVLDLRATSDRLVRRDIYMLPRPLTGPHYRLDSLVVLDRQPYGSGNGDGSLGPGEEATLVPYLSNTGDRTGHEVAVELSTDLYYVETLSGSETLPSLVNDGVSQPAPTGFRVRVKANAPPGTMADLRVSIRDNMGCVADHVESVELR
jgi:hypothetical protein